MPHNHFERGKMLSTLKAHLKNEYEIKYGRFGPENKKRILNHNPSCLSPLFKAIEQNLSTCACNQLGLKYKLYNLQRV